MFSCIEQLYTSEEVHFLYSDRLREFLTWFLFTGFSVEYKTMIYNSHWCFVWFSSIISGQSNSNQFNKIFSFCSFRMLFLFWLVLKITASLSGAPSQILRGWQASPWLRRLISQKKRKKKSLWEKSLNHHKIF